MMDKLKHLDGHSDEIHELVETVPLNQLPQAASEQQFCPKCVGVSLLEWAAYAAICAGASAGEIMSAVANGTAMGEEENEQMEAGLADSTWH